MVFQQAQLEKVVYISRRDLLGTWLFACFAVPSTIGFTNQEPIVAILIRQILPQYQFQKQWQSILVNSKNWQIIFRKK